MSGVTRHYYADVIGGGSCKMPRGVRPCGFVATYEADADARTTKLVSVRVESRDCRVHLENDPAVRRFAESQARQAAETVMRRITKDWGEA